MLFQQQQHKQMGSGESNATIRKKKEQSKEGELIVVTLNYCGIMNSPYEFYVQGKMEQLEAISDIFMQITKREVSQFRNPSFDEKKFKWKGSKIDHKFREQRYSPMFNMMIGIQNHRFLTRRQFQDKWQEVFDQRCPEQFRGNPKEDKQALKLYDVIMFNTLLKWVFKVQTIDQAKGKDTNQYIKKLRPLFELSFLNESRKLKKTTESLQKMQADVFIFQEYSKRLYNHVWGLGTYHIATDVSGDTLIMVRKKKFPDKKPQDLEKALQLMSDDVRKDLQMSGKTGYMVIDKYIIISLHLSSKEEQVKQQVKRLKIGLLQLQKVYPDMKIIAAGDVNTYIPPSEEFIGPNLFYMFPTTKEEQTTIKMRTYAQAQFKKANELIKQSKDKIISTLPIKDSKIMYISQKQLQNKQQECIPSDEHPFDHFVCKATLIIK